MNDITRYSKTTGCFYPLSESYTSLPDDLIEVPVEDYERAMERGERDTLDVVDGRVVIIPGPGPSVAEVRTARWEAIKNERDRRTQNGGYKVGTKWFHSDTFSRTQQMGLVILGINIPANTPWKTMDGTVVTMTQALAGQIFAAAAANDIAIFAAAETHRLKMEASADPANYDFSSGWPESYGS